MRPTLTFGAAFAVIASAGHAVADVKIEKKGAFVVLSSTATIKATPRKVWNALASPEGISAVEGFKSDAAVKSLKAVGDYAVGTLAGNQGVLVITMARPEAELRVSWEPTGAHYLCSARFVLRASGDSTVLEAINRYTDEKAAQVDENAKMAAKDLSAALERFKTFVEESRK